MSRYIDAEWLKAFFEADKGKSRNTPIDSLLALIGDAPSIDIVRCRECKYFWKYSDLPTKCVYHLSLVNADDFCSYGERSE